MESESQIELTELEGMVLARVAKDGPLTAYEIKEGFRLSPSGFWSGSAGAVYPLVKRLEDRGILRSQDISETKRPKRVFSLTEHGQSLMHHWLSDIQRAIDPGYDPLRSRIQFIHLLPPEIKASFLDKVEASIDSIPSPLETSEHVNRLHNAWIESRQQWFLKMKHVISKE